MERHHPRRVESYAGAFVATAGLVLFIALLTLAAAVGTLAVLLGAAALDALFRLVATSGPTRSGRS